jgi:uncharacterized Zn finger protein
MSSSSSPEDLLDRTLLRQLAGEKAFSQGEAYFAEGRVRQLHASSDRVTARVNGTRPYRVKLWRGRGRLRFSCTCAAGREEKFCKHCAAVGLAWLAGPEAQPAPATAPRAGTASAAGKQDEAFNEPPRETLRDHLRGLEKDRLVSLVLEATDYDDILRRRLLLEAIGVAKVAGRRPSAASPGALEPNIEAYRQILREAIECADYVDYDAMPDYAQSVEEAIRPLGELLRSGHAREAVDLAEFALIELDRASEMLDGGDGSLNGVYDDLQHYHLEGSRAAGLEPEELAVRLLAFEIEGGLGIFNNAVRNYAEVLGERGVSAWRQELIRLWSRLPILKPGEAGAGRGPIDHRRFQVTALMERLARDEADQTLLMAIKQRDLSSPHDFLALAELAQNNGQTAEALVWAERGIEAFPSVADDAGLRDFVVDAYRAAGREGEAAEMLWQQFAVSGGVEYYRKLQECARLGQPAEAERWRQRARAHVRNQIVEAQAAAAASGSSIAADHSALVEIELADGQFDQAWAEANAGGCRPDLWTTLALEREKHHPADALRIYQERLGPIIAQGGQNAYREAVELVARIQALLERLGRAEEFPPYRAGIRAANRQRRTFLKLLDASGR